MLLDKEFQISREAKAALISIVCPTFADHKTEVETLRSLNELKELLRTLKVPVLLESFQNKKSLDPASVVGQGKLKEFAQEAKDLGASLLVCDFELTASQIRNIREITGLDVVDRVHIILEIFSRHAQTKEAKIQIEIARLKYLLPRLSGLWGHFSRQKGGVGVRGGEGEQQIELDRRMIRRRIEFYEEELKAIKKERKEQGKRRRNRAITAALVGYTNAGKSSVMNRLCRVNVLEENKLFATLDSTFRMLNPDTHPPMILIDTVGFISNLPNTLIEGFRTTLDSALEADLLLIVCDISDPHYKKHLEVTQNVLKELNLEGKDQIVVFNKKDLLKDQKTGMIIKRGYPNSFLISSLDEEDIGKLREHIVNYFLSKQASYDLFLPYENGEAHSIIKAKTNIQNTVHHEKGIFYRIKIPDFLFQELSLKSYLLAPGHDLDRKKDF